MIFWFFIMIITLILPHNCQEPRSGHRKVLLSHRDRLPAGSWPGRFINWNPLGPLKVLLLGEWPYFCWDRQGSVFPTLHPSWHIGQFSWLEIRNYIVPLGRKLWDMNVPFWGRNHRGLGRHIFRHRFLERKWAVVAPSGAGSNEPQMERFDPLTEHIGQCFNG